RRYASNISFHAAACTLAVWVRTPSRSKRQARIAPGNPNCCASPGTSGPYKNKEAPGGAPLFAESVSLSSTVLVDLRLPPTALGLGFVLLALRARRARESRWPRAPAQEVPDTKMSQFGRSALRPFERGWNRCSSSQREKRSPARFLVASYRAL